MSKQQLLIYRDGRLKVENLALTNPNIIKLAEYWPLQFPMSSEEADANMQAIDRLFVLVAKTKAYDVYEER